MMPDATLCLKGQCLYSKEAQNAMHAIGPKPDSHFYATVAQALKILCLRLTPQMKNPPGSCGTLPADTQPLTASKR